MMASFSVHCSLKVCAKPHPVDLCISLSSLASGWLFLVYFSLFMKTKGKYFVYKVFHYSLFAKQKSVLLQNTNKYMKLESVSMRDVWFLQIPAL